MQHNTPDKSSEKSPSEPSSSWFGSIIWGPHSYTVTSPPVCNIHDKDGRCSQQAVFEEMRSRRSHVTPTSQTERVEEGSTTTIPVLGPVSHHVDEAHHSVTNTTQSTHLLHPGTVVRQVQEQPSGDIVVVTTGGGDGLLPGANRSLAPYVWGGPDTTLREDWQKKGEKDKDKEH